MKYLTINDNATYPSIYPNLILDKENNKVSFGKEDIDTNCILKHWYCGKDNLVSGYWVDRLNSSKKVLAKNSPIHGNDYYEVGHIDGESTYKTENNRYFTANGLDLFSDIGNYWKILFEVYLYNDDTDIANIPTNGGKGFYLMDNSTCQRNKATSFTVGFDNIRNYILTENYKMFGNTTSSDHPNYRVNNPANITVHDMSINQDVVVSGNMMNSNVPVNKWITLEWGCKKYDSSKSIQFAKINNGLRFYAQETHNNISFSGQDTTINNLNGNFIIGGAPVKGDYQLSGRKFKVRNIKVYSIEY